MQLCSWSSPCWLSFTQNEVFSLLFQSDFWEVLSAGRVGVHGVSGIFYRQQGSKRAYLPCNKERSLQQKSCMTHFSLVSINWVQTGLSHRPVPMPRNFFNYLGKNNSMKKTDHLATEPKGIIHFVNIQATASSFYAGKTWDMLCRQTKQVLFENCSRYIRTENRKGFCWGWNIKIWLKIKGDWAVGQTMQ